MTKVYLSSEEAAPGGVSVRKDEHGVYYEMDEVRDRPSDSVGEARRSGSVYRRSDTKRTPGGGSPPIPKKWYNLEPTDLSTLDERELTELREYLMDIHSDAREGRSSREDTMPHYLTDEDELMREVLDVVRMVDDELYERDMKSKDVVFDSDDIERIVMSEIGSFVESGSVSEEEAIEGLERVKRRIRQSAPETYYRSDEDAVSDSGSRVYVGSRQDVPQGRQARMDKEGSVFYTLSQEPKEASNSVAQAFREEYPDDLEDETPGTTDKSIAAVENLNDRQSNFVDAVVRSVDDMHSQRDVVEIIESERPASWREVSEELVRMYSNAVDLSSPVEVVEASIEGVVDEVLTRYSSLGGPLEWYDENVMSDSVEQERGYPYSSEYRPQYMEGRPSLRRSKGSQFLCPNCSSMTFSGGSKGGRYCPECGEYVRTERDTPDVDISETNYVAGSRKDDDVDPDEIEDPDNDGVEEFDIEGDPDGIEDPDDDGEEEMNVDPSEDDEKEDPCWDGYEMIGTKVVDGEEVPNCVPKSDSKSVAKQELREGLEWSEKVEIIDIDEEENEVTLEDQLTGSTWSETVDDIEAKLEAINERDHGWLYDMIEGQYPEIDSSAAHEVLHEFDRLADDPSEEVLENMARVSKTIQKYGNRLYIAEQEDVPSQMEAEFDGEHYVVETGNPDQLAREIAPQSVSRETGFEIEWVEAPKGSEDRATLLAESLPQRDYNVAQEYVDSGDMPREAIKPAIENMWGDVNRIDRENALDMAASYLDERGGYRRSSDRVGNLERSSGCPECGSDLMEKGECQVCGCQQSASKARPKDRAVRDVRRVLNEAKDLPESVLNMPDVRNAPAGEDTLRSLLYGIEASLRIVEGSMSMAPSDSPTDATWEQLFEEAQQVRRAAEMVSPQNRNAQSVLRELADQTERLAEEGQAERL